jgi:hypothetical protein
MHWELSKKQFYVSIGCGSGCGDGTGAVPLLEDQPVRPRDGGGTIGRKSGNVIL